MSVRIGIVGLGMMGRTHYEAYQKIPDAEVVAVADQDPRRAAGDLSGTGGNVLADGLEQLPMDRIRGFTDPAELMALDDLDVVDICVHTPHHVTLATAALASGKHVLCEKPLARTAADAQRIADAAAQAAGHFMPAMCMRFWPGWREARAAIVERRYGRVLGATFRRAAPPLAGWYNDGAISGGALLDLHVHDTDFVNHCFGSPQAVFSRGYSRVSGAIDHVVTQYLYPDGLLVSAEGTWAMAEGFPFTMRFTINCEQGTLDFDLGREQPLHLIRDGAVEPLDLPPGTGYDGELAYFVDCIGNGRRPELVTADDAVTGLRIVEAELASIESGAPAPVAAQPAAAS